MNVTIVNVMGVIAVVPNKKAKERKRQRRLKNEWLTKYGRTSKQVARWKRKNKGKGMTEKKRW